LLPNNNELERLRLGVRSLDWGTWDEEWNKAAKPVFAFSSS